MRIGRHSARSWLGLVGLVLGGWSGLAYAGGPLLQQAAPTSCASAVYWADVGNAHPRLGCATYASSTDTTFQEFEQGLMIWRKDPSPSRIYVLARYPQSNAWAAFVDHSPDPYVSANPDPGCPDYQRRAKGMPASAFDTLWCEPWNWKLELGEPTVQTRTGGHNLIQEFQGGTVFSLADGPGVILYTDGTWETFGP
jgi:hypothetical protein